MTPKVSIIMGSTSDMPIMQEAAKILNEFKIPFEINALSAHRVPEEVAAFAKNAHTKGIRVIIAGLDLDFQGKPFGPMPQLMAMAEYVTKVHAICMQCGNLAYVSYRKIPDDKLVLLGETDNYEPLCRACYNKMNS